MQAIMSESMDRRKVMKAAGGVLLLRPETVFGSQENSTIELGLVGCGVRGNWIAPLFTEHTNARFVAAADVIRARLDPTRVKLGVAGERAYHGPNAAREL